MGKISDHLQTIESNRHFDFVQITEGVFACIHILGGSAICNVGVVNLGSETLVFDSFMSPHVARMMLDCCLRHGLPPIKYVINSHWHSDHVRGNQVFSDDVEIISTSVTRQLMKEKIPAELKTRDEALQHLRKLKNDITSFSGSTEDRTYQEKVMWLPFFEEIIDADSKFELRYPNSLVDHERIISGSLREVHLLPTGPAHTLNDLVVHIPDQDVLLASDLVHTEMHPYFSDGNISGLKKQLQNLVNMNPTYCVPGHGPISGIGAIKEMIRYVASVEEAAQYLKERAHDSIGTDIEVPKAYTDWWFPKFYEKNVHFILTNE